MTTKTYPQLAATTSVADGDLFASYSGAGPLKRLTALIVQAYMQDGTMLLTGAEPMTGPLELAAGTEALPGLTFDGDTDVGLYRIGANNFGVTVGGVKQGEWSSRGYIARPSTVSGSGFALPPGVAPTSPVDGEMWTSDALYVQINGVTVRLATASFIRINRSSDTTLTAADSGAFVSLTGTFAQTFDPCAALGDGWWCFAQSRTGVISYTPDGSEQIDGYDSIPGNPNEIRIVFCDGADLTSVVVTPFDALYAATGAILWPPGYSGFDLNALGGGGGGGSGARSTSAGTTRSSGGSAGGGGADKDRFVPSADVTVNASTVVTVPAAAAGGASQTSQNSDGLDGTDGGAAVVGAYLTANGGSKGLAGTSGNGTHAGGSGGSYFSTATTSETTSIAGTPSLYAGGFGGGSTPLGVGGAGVASVNGGSGGGGGGSCAGDIAPDLRAAGAGGSSASASGIGGGGQGGGTTQGLAGSPGVLRGVGGGGGAGRDSTAAAAGAGGAGGPGAGGGGGGVASGDNGGGGALATASGAGGTGGAPQVRIRGVI